MKINPKNIKTLYMAVTKDEYELPIAVADSVLELSRMLGMKRETLAIYFSLGRTGFHKIDVSNDVWFKGRLIMDKLIEEYMVKKQKLENRYDDVWEKYCYYRDGEFDDIPDDIYNEEKKLSEIIDECEVLINTLEKANSISQYISESLEDM